MYYVEGEHAQLENFDTSPATHHHRNTPPPPSNLGTMATKYRIIRERPRSQSQKKKTLDTKTKTFTVISEVCPVLKTRKREALRLRRRSPAAAAAVPAAAAAVPAAAPAVPAALAATVVVVVVAAEAEAAAAAAAVRMKTTKLRRGRERCGPAPPGTWGEAVPW